MSKQPQNLDILDGPSWHLAQERFVTYPIGNGNDMVLVATFARTTSTRRLFRRSVEEFMHISFPMRVGDWTAGHTMTNFAESLAAALFTDPARNALCNRWSSQFTTGHEYVAHPLLVQADAPPIISQQLIIGPDGSVSQDLVKRSKGTLGVISWHNYSIEDVAGVIEGNTSCLLLSDDESSKYADRLDPSWRLIEKALREDREEITRLFLERYGLD